MSLLFANLKSLPARDFDRIDVTSGLSTADRFGRSLLRIWLNFAGVATRRIHYKAAANLTRWVGDQNGNVAIIFAMAAPVLLSIVGGAIDYGSISSQRSKLQYAANSAAIAVAKEYRVTIDQEAQARSVAETMIRANLGPKANDFKFELRLTSDPTSAAVSISQEPQTYFSTYFATAPITVQAEAELMGGVPLCVLGLGERLSGTITLQEKARLTGDECAVYSNSNRSDGIVSKSGALLQAGLICSVGGEIGTASNFDPEPITDCPPMEDPLADRPAPSIGSCTETDLLVGVDNKEGTSFVSNMFSIAAETSDESSSTDPTGADSSTNTKDGAFVTLYPGVYCGGIIIGGGVHVEFRPGTYIMKDGPLHVSGGATVEGEHVGFYLTGATAVFFFGANTSVNFSAPADGPLAGLLFYEDQNSFSLRQFAILSDDARKLEGTIYLPKAYLYIDADRPIADESAYTAIIVQRLALFSGPHLVLNTDYDQTDVPVPEGVKGVGQSVRLTK